MARRRAARRPRRKLQVFICVVVAIVIILILLKVFFIGPIKEKAIDSLAEQMIQSEISSDETGADVDTQAILDAMSEEDRDTLEGIISDNLSPETIKDASSYLANGDMQGLKEYAKESLSEEDLQEIKDLYLKYKDEIRQNVQQ